MLIRASLHINKQFVCFVRILLLAACLMASGCAGPGVEGLPEMALSSEADDNTGKEGIPERYLLQPGDSVHIEVFREPEISGTFSLDNKGVIRHPLLGFVTLEGLTASEAEALIRYRLGEDYLVNPRVILRIDNIASSQVLIMGEVNTPGIVNMAYGEKLTLLEAIARADGFTDMASPNRIRIVRTVDGRRSTIRVRVADILAGKGRDRDVLLEPNDVITVPEVRF